MPALGFHRGACEKPLDFTGPANFRAGIRGCARIIQRGRAACGASDAAPACTGACKGSCFAFTDRVSDFSRVGQAGHAFGRPGQRGSGIRLPVRALRGARRGKDALCIRHSGPAVPERLLDDHCNHRALFQQPSRRRPADKTLYRSAARTHPHTRRDPRFYGSRNQTLLNNKTAADRLCARKTVILKNYYFTASVEQDWETNEHTAFSFG